MYGNCPKYPFCPAVERTTLALSSAARLRWQGGWSGRGSLRQVRFAARPETLTHRWIQAQCAKTGPASVLTGKGPLRNMPAANAAEPRNTAAAARSAAFTTSSTDPKPEPEAEAKPGA